MKPSNFKLIPFLTLLLSSCSPDAIIDEDLSNQTNSNGIDTTPTNTKVWAFNELKEWEDASFKGIANYSIENGSLNIFTTAATWERNKVKTISSFDECTYTWRVYIPEMGVGDKASIGAFLYYNDTHEIDFEIGYGSKTKRAELKAEADDLLVYMTSQGNPFHSQQVKIKRAAWYTLSVNLTLNSNNQYITTWKINDITRSSVQLTYGNNTKFNIYCSVENLDFIGDHIPSIKNYALFDSVEFKENIKRK